MILSDAERFTEPLEMHDFSFTKEADGVAYIRVLYKTKDVVVSRTCLLFCGHIFIEICDRVAFGLEFTRIERDVYKRQPLYM